MIFLIQYDRDEGHLVKLRSFDDTERTAADETRLRLELDLKSRGVDDEVVILEAPNEQALRQTHRRYFENLQELASKAFATGLFQGAQVTFDYMKERYPFIDSAPGSSESGYKTACIKGLWSRAYLWMQTMIKLNDPLDFQAISVANRSLLEILVDLILLHQDKTYRSAARMFWWTESEKLKSAEQIVNFYTEEGLAVPDEFEAQKVFYQTKKSNIEKMRSELWPNRKNPAKHPDRWTGTSSLFDDIKKADQIYGPIVKREVGVTLTEYYRTQYRKMNWRIHSGIASFWNQPAEAFYLVSGFAFKWSADFAMLCTKLTLMDLGVDADAKLEQQWEHIKRKRDSVYIHELYKFHSDPASSSRA
jgi:hypothetical protein